MNRAKKRRRKKPARKAAPRGTPPPRSPSLLQNGGGRDGHLKNLFQKAVQFHEAGRLRDAEAGYRKILEINPDIAEVHCNLGSVQNNLGDHEAAEASHRRALALKPDYADAHCNLGNALCDLGRLEEAIASYHKALAVKPDFANALNSLGSALQELERHGEAVGCFERALAIEPRFAEAHGNLGISLKELGRQDDSVASFLKALELKPDYAEAHSNLANSLKDLGRLDDALARYGQALTLKPDYAEAHCNRGSVLTYMGELDEATVCYEKALSIKPDYSQAAKNYLHTLLYQPGITNQNLYDAYQRLTRTDASGAPRQHRPRVQTGAAPERLRIGYLSSDFRDHPLGHNIMPLLGNHGHGRFEIFCYAELTQEDAITGHFRRHADHWRPITGLTDAQVAGTIEDDQIHLMVYLGGNFDKNRPSVATHRPAPVQVSMFGGTTSALDEMDFWLTDKVLHPSGTTEQFTEEPFRVANLFSYPVPENAPPVSTLPADENGFITFASFNKPSKMNGAVLDVWSEIMRTVPDARLILKFKTYLDSPQIGQKLLGRFRQNGISPERITLLSAEDRFHDHLARYHQADIGLDTFPFSGATTTFQALWMGVPVISLMGERFIGRMGGSLSSHAGLQSLTADNPGEFVERAVNLAHDLPRLRELRSTLRQRLKESPLCDGPTYALNMEKAFRTMWDSRS